MLDFFQLNSVILKIRLHAGMVYQKSLLEGVAEHIVLKSFPDKAEKTVIVLWS